MSAHVLFDLIIAGVGGQGSLFASKVVAQAAFQQGLSVRVAETYGVAQRGGSVYSQIRIGYRVCGPLIPKGTCQLILGLEPIEALRRATEYLAPGGIVVLNMRVNAPLETKMGKQPDLDFPTIVRELSKLEAGRVLEVDAWRLAEEAGGLATMNVVMLGALLSVESFPLTFESMTQAIEAVGKPAFLEQNIQSLARGREYGLAVVQGYSRNRVMAIDWDKKYSVRAAGLYGSMTRKLMHVMSDPDIISFGGGLPAWDLFPVEQVREVADDLLRTDGPATLQYSTSEGYRPLREQLVERYRQRGLDIALDNVIIDTGSMQGIDLAGKLFLDRGDMVLVGDPTFLTALQAFSFYRARYLTIPLDEQGMQVDRLPQVLENHEVKFIYIMPTFQNPSGRTLSLERRHRLVEIAAQHGVPIVEDDAYGELRYDGERLPPLKALDRQGSVIYLGSFSKILSPGLRVGFIVAPTAVLEKLVFAKQAADLHTSVLPQRIASEFLRRGLLDPHIQTLIENYRQRRDAMLAAMERHFPPDVTWTCPQGGIFIWVTLPAGMDAGQLFDDAVAEKVVYVPGSHYYANGGGENTLRLNFVAYDADTIDLGILRLARVIRRKRSLSR